MEKKNDKIRQAFELIEKQEIGNLPKEEQIVRVFSDSFNQRMDKLLRGTIENSVKSTKPKRIRWSALVAAALICMLVVTVAAGEMIPTFSEKWRERMTENIINADVGEGVEEFDAEYEKSTDPFAVVARETGAGKHIILNYSESIEYTDVIAEDEGYRFALKSITPAKQKHQVMTGGRLSDGSATFEWTVSEGYYAIIEIARCDGKALTREEKDTVDVVWNFLVAGYSPDLTNCYFRGNTIHNYNDEYKIYYAIEITEMMPFAKKDLALMAMDVFDYDNRDVNKDTLYADEKGNLKPVNEDEYFGVLLRFSVPEEYASDDEHYAEKYFELKPYELKNWMNSYQTNATE